MKCVFSYYNSSITNVYGSYSTGYDWYFFGSGIKLSYNNGVATDQI